MCIECWWECLNETQQMTLFVIAVLGGALWLSACIVEVGERTARWYHWPLPSVVGAGIVGVVLYSLYGAIACLFGG